MPSLRTIFLLATATLASFTSAVPQNLPAGDLVDIGVIASVVIDVLPVSALETPKPNAIGVVSDYGGVDPRHVVDSDVDTSALVGKIEQEKRSLVSAAADLEIRPLDGIEQEKRGDDEPDSLPVVLLILEASLRGILDDLNTTISAAVTVDAEVVAPIFGRLRTAVDTAIVSVEALIGLDLKVILALSDKVLTVVDVAHILLVVLTLLCNILALIVKVTGITPLIDDVAALVAALLAIIFQLVTDLLSVLVPLIPDAIKVIVELNLVAILDVLKTAH